MKRSRPVLGTISTPVGQVRVRSRHIDALLTAQEQEIERLHGNWQREMGEHQSTKLRLAALQNHPLVRFGELLRLVRP